MASTNLCGYAGNSVRSSPFEPGLLAVATAANWGIVGNGRLSVLRLAERPGDAALSLEPVASFETSDVLYDVAWSELHPALLVSASGDGALRLHSLEQGQQYVAAYSEHGGTRRATSSPSPRPPRACSSLCAHLSPCTPPCTPSCTLHTTMPLPFTPPLTPRAPAHTPGEASGVGWSLAGSKGAFASCSWDGTAKV